MQRLFVINQDTPASRLIRLLREDGGGSTVILCSHHPFRAERLALLEAAPGAQVLEFADVLSDADNAFCDERAVAEARGHGVSEVYGLASLYKNRLLHERMGTAARIWYTPGLGVHHDHWRSVGASLLRPELSRRLRILRYRFRAAVASGNDHDHMLINGDDAMLFHGPIHRVAISPESDVEIIVLAAAGSLAKARQLAAGRRLRRATTVHFAMNPRAADADVLIFSDGYHPPNYPRSYLSGLAGRTMVARDMFDRDWFAAHGLQVVSPPSFLRRETMRIPRPARDPACVVLALNHAGDWTAQINRGDTDRLVEAFLDCARQHPGPRYRLRPHPTMVHPRHEGVASLDRLAAQAQAAGVELSLAPLERDLDEGDVFVSEYSNVLIEAWKRGKLGFSANLTERRNFMSPYTSLGFAHADNAQVLAERILSACSGNSVREQAAAVDRFNAALARFLAGPWEATT